MSVAVVLCYFSPAGYRLPAQHFQTVVQTLHAQDVPLAVAQAVLPGQDPQPVPAAVPQLVLQTESVLWHKERLWNIAARQLTEADKLLFLDADVVFSRGDWLNECSQALDDCDVIQPFSQCRWLDERGVPDMHRPPVAVAIRDGETPRLARFHTGFGWGMTRQAFDALGGFYDLSVCGNSDSLFGLSLRDNAGHRQVLEWFNNRQDSSVSSPTYQRYRQRAVGLNLSVGVPVGVTVTHLWHGHREHRQYVDRGRLFPRRADREYATHDAANGLLAWDDVEASNAAVMPYFVGKRDDG